MIKSVLIVKHDQNDEELGMVDDNGEVREDAILKSYQRIVLDELVFGSSLMQQGYSTIDAHSQSVLQNNAVSLKYRWSRLLHGHSRPHLYMLGM